MPELPTAFGKYFLTEKLATGGMAEIYLAKIVGPGGFEKSLVIKQIHPKLTGQRHFVDLFVAEAKTLVSLAHGNIVPVYELGVVDDTYFIAMEYIDGPTLYRLTEALNKQGAQMAPALAAWVTARIVEGLDYAHRKGEGVIHRDLSPRNVMLSRDGEVKLVDFGIAVTLSNAGEDDSAQSAPTGSFPYMSPEQVRKEQLTGQTDLFSVGVLCWEMLTGRRLFARPDPEATLQAVTGLDIPRPSTINADIPARLDDVVMRALERDTTSRWRNAAEMLGALNKYLYSLDDTPGARDLAALVARYCPPETRRMPTHADAVEGGDTQATPPPAGAGPSTAVIPRDAQARGRVRAPTRQESFATNVQLDHILERGTPLFGVPTVEDAPALPDEPTTSARSPEPAPDSTLRMREGGPAPRSQFGLVIAGLGALGLSIGAIVVFMRGRDAVLAPDAMPKLDAPFYVQMDAPAVEDAPVDASPDAAVEIVVDAAPPPRDAAPTPTPPRDAAPPARDAAVATGTGTLNIGADPWGEIVVDGVKRGRTPKRIEVSAGNHTVEIVFPAEDPPRTKSFKVDVGTGETKDVVADFTKL